MKKAVITILGLINPPANGDSAKYYFSNDLKDNFYLKKENYVNMLPLIIDNFSNEYAVECIYTNGSLATQKKVLEYEQIEFNIENSGVFISEDIYDKDSNEIEESKYSYFLKQYNKIIEKYDSVIIDVSHGFRHFPILATVNLIIQNIKNPEKIEYILFAKEIVRYKEYEIIDLREYLALANLTYLLSSFNQNYTVSTNVQFKNSLYKNIANELQEFSNHFLSNSLKPLIEGNLIVDLIKNLNQLKENKALEHFDFYIDNIIKHLSEIIALKDKSDWERMYELSKIMDSRGYQLNAITLLFEATGFYCLEKLEKALPTVKNRAKDYRKFIEENREPRHIYSIYTMTNQIRNLVKLKHKFKLTDERTFVNSESLKREVIDYIDDIASINKFNYFIKSLESLRNNLAHGNSSESIEDVKQAYKNAAEKFKRFCIDIDILNNENYKPKNSIDRLKDKLSNR